MFPADGDGLCFREMKCAFGKKGSVARQAKSSHSLSRVYNNNTKGFLIYYDFKSNFGFTQILINYTSSHGQNWMDGDSDDDGGGSGGQ